MVVCRIINRILQDRRATAHAQQIDTQFCAGFRVGKFDVFDAKLFLHRVTETAGFHSADTSIAREYRLGIARNRVVNVDFEIDALERAYFSLLAQGCVATDESHKKTVQRSSDSLDELRFIGGLVEFYAA